MTSAASTRAARTAASATSEDRLRTYGVLQLVLAGALLVNSLLGPLILGVVSYPITATMESQLIGLELVTVFLVVPWATAVGIAALRGHPAAPLLGCAPAAYAAYMFAQYVLGPEYTRYSVTVLAHLGIFVLAAGLTGASWSLSRTTPLPPMRRAQTTRNGWVLLALAAFVVSRYAAALVGAIGGERLGSELLEEPTFFWSIFLLDLGLVVPCTMMAAWGLMRGSADQRALYAVVGWFALVPPSVAAMALVMWARDDPHASLRSVVVLGIASLLFGTFAWHTLRGLVRTPATADPR